jgi:hypothetical protein
MGDESGPGLGGFSGCVGGRGRGFTACMMRRHGLFSKPAVFPSLRLVRRRVNTHSFRSRCDVGLAAWPNIIQASVPWCERGSAATFCIALLCCRFCARLCLLK